MHDFSLYGGQDPRDLPAYSLTEVSHYLRIPRSTLRSWVKGRTYPTETGLGFFEPLITPPDGVNGTTTLLSFINMVEAHVLDALRRRHRIALHKVREALTYLEEHFPSKHPLADQKFETDGMYLFVEMYGYLINITQDGQLAMRDLLQVYLSRIERDTAGFPIRLYLFSHAARMDVPAKLKNEPKVIAIDPYISFGRPVLAGTGITTAIIAERYKAGESIEQLAEDYDRPPHDIQEAIRCELETKAA